MLFFHSPYLQPRERWLTIYTESGRPIGRSLSRAILFPVQMQYPTNHTTGTLESHGWVRGTPCRLYVSARGFVGDCEPIQLGWAMTTILALVITTVALIILREFLKGKSTTIVFIANNFNSKGQYHKIFIYEVKDEPYQCDNAESIRY